MLYNGIDISFTPHNEALLEAQSETSTRRTERVDLVWKDLCFTVPVKASKEKKPSHLGSSASLDKSNSSGIPPSQSPKSRREKLILDNVSGYVRTGTMLAVMGSSGAGKTSLLNLLAGRITTSKGATATGSVFLNGQPRDYSKFTKFAAYVLQDDDMFAELTVEEQITYAALLRLPQSMPKEKKLMRVQKIIQELGLGKVATTMIGNQLVRGISGGERKRVNIGTELVTDPCLLFLDEPTTGLDSFNALNVMTSLRQLACNGRTIVSTIHQPRSSIFALFDQLCLLSEGRVMYFGPAKGAVTYFAALNFHSPSHFNPADFFLDILSVDHRTTQSKANTTARVQFIGDRYAAQEEPCGVVDEPDLECRQEEEENDSKIQNTLFQSSWINQFTILCNRSLKLALRERTANGARFGQVLFFSIILGLIWLNNGRSDEEEVRKSIPGVFFFLVINQAFGGVFSVIFGFPLERSIVTRERASNTYRTSAYFLSKTMTDLPKTLFFNVLFACIVYWMIGLTANFSSFVIFIVIIFLTSFLAESLAIAISVLAGDAQTAAAIIPVFVILAMLFGGFFIGSDEIGSWISWAKYVSFVFYAFNALGHNEVDREGYPDTLRNEFNNLSVVENISALIAILVVFRVIGYLFLHYLRGPKFLKF